jgi:UDP-N-acetyl-D-glucosamine/UDP-N-acetyl-D-galactosamine dehydrogenase
MAVSHDKYKTLEFTNKNQIIYDIKSILKNSDGRL